jgi:hypothetical protein
MCTKQAGTCRLKSRGMYTEQTGSGELNSMENIHYTGQ